MQSMINSTISSSNCRSTIPDTMSTQEQLLSRVSELLQNEGVMVRGTGSLALDIDESGEIEVIGNIENKEEVEAALGDDSELLAILQRSLSEGKSRSASNPTSIWEQEAYTVELNGQKIEDELVDKVDSATDGNKLVSTKPENILSVAPGTEVAVSGVKDVKKDDFLSVKGGEDVKSLLGLEGEDSSYERIIDQVQMKIDALKDEGMSMVKDMLAQTGIQLGDDEKFDLEVAEDNSIVVTAMEMEGRKLSKARLDEIQGALNADTDTADILANILKETTGFCMALSDLSLSKTMELKEDTVLSIIESRIGMNINDAVDSTGNFISGNEKLDEFVKNNKELASRILNKSGQEALSKTSEFTFTGQTLSSDVSHKNNIQNKQNFKNNWRDALDIYRNMFDRSGIIMEDYDIFSDFSITVNSRGNIEDIDGEMADGSGVRRRLVREFFETARGGIGDFEVFINQMLEEHDTKHGDVEEFKHLIKIDFTNSGENASFQIISPEADKAAEKELKVSLQEINDNVNCYLAKNCNISTPVEVKVDEYGKLAISDESLAAAEEMQAKRVIDMINNAVGMSEMQEEDDDVSAPKGLELAFDKAKGLKGILAKFHEKENLNKAIQ